MFSSKRKQKQIPTSQKKGLDFEGEPNYSYIYLANNKKKLTTKTIGDIEELLNDKGFFQMP